MEIKEKTDMMTTMIDRLIEETDHDIKCMVIILITRLSNIPTIKVGIILEELYNQVNGYRHDENRNVNGIGCLRLYWLLVVATFQIDKGQASTL
jgi:hypothetical protein